MSIDVLTEHPDTEFSARYATVEAPRHPGAQRLLAFWAARSEDGIVMSRDVPSRAIADLLSNISVLEPTADRTDMRVRLVGASSLKRFGSDVKGRLLSELFPDAEFRDHMKSLRTALESDRPVIVESSLVACAVAKLQFEVVLLPVFSPDRAGRWILSGMFYFR